MRALILLVFLINSCMSTTNTPNNNANDNDHTSGRTVLYSFVEQGKSNWRVQDDVVMGGKSDSQLKMTEENRAHFQGRVSLENNGGFCSIQQRVENNPYIFTDKSSFFLRLKGDGKNYNFRVRTPQGKHAYAFSFPTKSGDEWETIAIPFYAMEATYRGRSVDVPNYAGEDVVEIQILIGNKREENFELMIEAIEVH